MGFRLFAAWSWRFSKVFGGNYVQSWEQTWANISQKHPFDSHLLFMWYLTSSVKEPSGKTPPLSRVWRLASSKKRGSRARESPHVHPHWLCGSTMWQIGMYGFKRLYFPQIGFVWKYLALIPKNPPAVRIYLKDCLRIGRVLLLKTRAEELRGTATTSITSSIPKLEAAVVASNDLLLQSWLMPRTNAVWGARYQDVYLCASILPTRGLGFHQVLAEQSIWLVFSLG